MPSASITLADALDGLRALPDNSVDAVITDPPYGLTDISAKKLTDAMTHWVQGERDYVPAGRGFMGNAWDKFVPPPALWDEAFRVLKPGGYLVSFAGARTVDLMGLSIRLAGFRVKDILAWVRADAFAKTPQSLKPGHEPIVMAQKPLDGTVEQNIDRWGTGGLNIEDCRVEYRNEADEAETKTKNAHGRFGTRHGGNDVFGNFGDELREDYNPPGRWPSNTVLSQEAADGLDAAYPSSKSRAGKPRTGKAGDGWGMTKGGTEHNDIGGPSRFFPLIEETFDAIDEEFTELRFAYAGRAPVKERPVSEDGTKHPTVKPLSVMRWLVRLVAPHGGLVADPFTGSGTTLEAAVLEGRDAVGFESHAPFIPLVEQRIARCGAGSIVPRVKEVSPAYEPEDEVTIDQAAEILGVSPQRVRDAQWAQALESSTFSGAPLKYADVLDYQSRYQWAVELLAQMDEMDEDPELRDEAATEKALDMLASIRPI